MIYYYYFFLLFFFKTDDGREITDAAKFIQPKWRRNQTARDTSSRKIVSDTYSAIERKR